MNNVIRSLHELAAFLDDIDVAYALIGGLAVSIHSEPRFTADVDLVVAAASDEEAEHIIFRLISRGYQTNSVVEQSKSGRLAMTRLQLGDHAVADLLFASSGVEPEIVAGALRLEVVPDLILPVAQIGDLIVLKLLASSKDRPQDQMDLVNLVAVANISDLERARWIAEQIMQRGTNRGRDLLDLLSKATQDVSQC